MGESIFDSVTYAILKKKMESKANIDGSYSSLTAGNAEQLVSTVGVTEQTPYLFRTTGGSADVGDRVKLSNITGGTVALNQMVANGNFASTTGWSAGGSTTLSASDNVITAVSSNGAAYMGFYQNNGAKAITGHKYFMHIEGKTSAADLDVYTPYYDTDAITNAVTHGAIGTSWTTIERIVQGKADAYIKMGIRKLSGAYGSKATINGRNAYIIDLTQMFGSTIADYLYTLESGTAGAGVAKLKSWGFCTAEYYAYDTGSMLSVKTTAHKTYDEENTLIGNYPLDDVELRGIPKLDDNNNLYYSGDSYTPDGTVTRRFAIVNLGDKTWTEISMSNGRKGYTIPFSDLAGTPAGQASDTWCDSLVSNGLYSQVRQGASTWPAGSYVFSQGGGIFGNQNFGFVTDGSFTDAAAFKASMSGVYLVYELATATTESADPYQERQICANDGTEEFVDSRTVPMPVGSVSFYQNNLRSKLEAAPESPSLNGDYIMRRTNSGNAYVPLIGELPADPTEDGTYTLKVTVTDGTATLSWVADE